MREQDYNGHKIGCEIKTFVYIEKSVVMPTVDGEQVNGALCDTCEEALTVAKENVDSARIHASGKDAPSVARALSAQKNPE